MAIEQAHTEKDPDFCKPVLAENIGNAVDGQSQQQGPLGENHPSPNRDIGVRDGGSGGQLTPQFGQIYDIYSGKKQDICLTNCVTPNGTSQSIYLTYISGGVTNETFIG